MKNKLIISSIYFIIVSITVAIVLAVWVYFSLNTERGFSSDYIKKRVVEQFNNQNKYINIDLENIKLRFLDGGSTLGLKAQKLLLYNKDKPVAQMDNVYMSLSIWDIINGEFPVSSLNVDGGRVIFHNDDNSSQKISPKHIIGTMFVGSSKIFKTMYRLEKVNLSNLNIQYSDNQGMLLVYRDVNVGIVKKSNILQVEFLGNLNAQLPNKQVIKTGVMSLKSEFNMQDKNILDLKLNAKGIDNLFDISLITKYNSTKDIFDGKFDFVLQDFATLGIIGLQEANILPKASASLSIRTTNYNVKKGGSVFFDGQVDKQIVNGEINVEGKQAKFDLYAEDINEEILQKYWNRDYSPKVRQWMLKNIVGSYDLNLRFNHDLSTKQISNTQGTVILKNAVVDYYSGLPPMKVKKAIGQFDENKIDIDVQKASIIAGRQNVDISNSKIKIFTKDNKTMMTVDTRLNAKWQNVLAYLKHPQINLKLPTPDLKNAQANTSGKLSMLFDISNFSLDKYSYKGKLKNVSVPKLNKFENLKSDTLNLIVNEKFLDATGKIKFNHTSEGDIKYKYKYAQNYSDLIYNGIFDTDTIYKYVDKNMLKVVQPVKLQIKYTNNNNKSQVFVKTDLTNNIIHIMPLEWNKQLQKSAFLDLNIKTDKKENYTANVSFKSESKSLVDINLFVTGDKDGINKIIGKDIKYSQGILGINAVRKNGYLTGNIIGKDFYVDVIRYALENMPSQTTKQKYDFTFELNNLKSFDGNIVSKMQGDIKYNGKVYDKLIVKMNMKRPEAQTYLYYDKKKLKLYTNNLGSTYSVIFGGQPIKNGWVSMNGDLEKMGYISGSLLVNDIEILDVPESTRILKLFSIFGVFEALQSKNLFFNKIKGKFTFKNGIYKTDNISAIGKTIAISAKGNININNNTLELKGMVLPSYKLASIFNKIPVLGTLVSGSDGQGPITQKYIAKGGFSDYEVKVNSTGFLTLGILRDVFLILVPDETEDIKVGFENEKISD